MGTLRLFVSSLTAQTGFIGSAANRSIVVATTLFLAAGRFGLAPSAKTTTASLRLRARSSKLTSGDPMGFTTVDTLAFGAMGHIIGVGIYLGASSSAIHSLS